MRLAMSVSVSMPTIMHSDVHQSTTIVGNKSGAWVHDCAHYAEMNVTDALRQYLRDAHAKSGKGVLAFEHSLGFPKSALKAVLSEQYNQVPSLDKAEKIADALGLELYLGPPRPTDPAQDQTTTNQILRGFVDDFDTKHSPDGRIGLEIFVPGGSARLGLTTAQARLLADKLTHRAMQIEEPD